MAISSRKHILAPLSLLILLLCVAVILALIPLDVNGRSPLVINQHNNNAQSSRYEDSQNVRRIQDAQRRVDEARMNVDKARNDVWNSYIPISPPYANDRLYNMNRAQFELDRAQSELRMRDNDLYFEKRLLESNQREQRLQQQRNEMRSNPIFKQK